MDKKYVLDFIESQRKLQKMRKNEFVRSLDVSSVTVGKMLSNGGMKVDFDTISKMLDVLGYELIIGVKK
jgi:hypothetical protein